MHGRLSCNLRTCLFAIALMAGAQGCGSDDELSDKELFGSTTGAPPKGAAVTGRFEADGHKLFMECRGTGSPTVVYLHGSVRNKGAGGGRNGRQVAALLDDRHRVCLYDRANVGRSDSARGPLTGRSSANDLHALLRTARVRGPYVLLGASLGGAISDIYAAKYPADVAGMVLLDSTLPAYLDMYKRLFPPGSGPQPGEWKNEAERLDRLVTFRQAGTVQGRRPRIPVTYIGIKSLLSPRITRVIRRAQRTFVERFSPGRLIVLDVPHQMEAVIPSRIAREVDRVIAAAKRQ